MHVYGGHIFIRMYVYVTRIEIKSVTVPASWARAEFVVRIETWKTG